MKKIINLSIALISAVNIVNAAVPEVSADGAGMLSHPLVGASRYPYPLPAGERQPTLDEVEAAHAAHGRALAELKAGGARAVERWNAYAVGARLSGPELVESAQTLVSLVRPSVVNTLRQFVDGAGPRVDEIKPLLDAADLLSGLGARELAITAWRKVLQFGKNFPKEVKRSDLGRARAGLTSLGGSAN